MTKEEKESLKALGARIKERREALGWRTRDMEAHTGIDAGNITKYENGQKHPSYLTLRKLSSGLGITVSEFLQGL